MTSATGSARAPELALFPRHGIHLLPARALSGVDLAAEVDERLDGLGHERAGLLRVGEAVRAAAPLLPRARRPRRRRRRRRRGHAPASSRPGVRTGSRCGRRAPAARARLPLRAAAPSHQRASATACSTTSRSTKPLNCETMLPGRLTTRIVGRVDDSELAEDRRAGPLVEDVDGDVAHARRVPRRPEPRCARTSRPRRAESVTARRRRRRASAVHERQRAAARASWSLRRGDRVRVRLARGGSRRARASSRAGVERRRASTCRLVLRDDQVAAARERRPARSRTTSRIWRVLNVAFMAVLSAGPATRASLKRGIRGPSEFEAKREGAVSRALGVAVRACG